MTKLYSIGEVARILNIPIKALRNYDQINLLKPSQTDAFTKYRYYSYDQFFIIDVIRYLNKTLNVPLEDIKILINESNGIDKLLTILESHQDHLNQKINDLEYSRKVTNGLITDLKYRMRNPEKIEIFEQYLLARTLYYNELNVSIYDLDKYVSRNAMDGFNKNNNETNVMCTYYSISEKQADNHLQVRGFGIFSDHKISGLKCKILPEGRYITKRFLYSEENLFTALSELVQFTKERNIHIDDHAYLVSKMVNVSVASKYNYYMDLQLLHLLHENE
ncbi:MerR family transcriptional regulator [Lacrimispora algidixylanolytica]|uniref:MerR family transcriptional regulator n=1 Tax=Lacrimispora algidixylanolytica TaxID=94868 RepID=A0A419SYA6_9FIRM|nr:helix-turn-helix domain-containing protein [Lacrimispora algidixylanolytica]RKD30186.1 MerR family transcriptional regulator [Lacrimispora algidixylanolytica]